MRRLSWLALPALGALALQSCNTVGFGVVSIKPVFGYVDGCTPVKVSGHGYGDDVKVTIGGVDLVDQVAPTAELDVGYFVTGTTPPGAAVGYVGVEATSGGVTDDIAFAEQDLDGDGVADDGDFYYQACPYDAFPEVLSQYSDVSSGTVIDMTGCNLKDGYQIKVGPANPVSMTVTCSTANASFTAPDLPEGDYYVAVVDSSGTQVFPALDSGCDTTGAVGASLGGSDTATFDNCTDVPYISYPAGAK